MIDIHSHIIPKVDDGASEIQEAIEMIKEAEKIGITDIFLTPHFFENRYEPNKSELLNYKQNLQNKILEENIKIKLHSGMEVYISSEINNLLKKDKLLTLANSKYILIELPMLAEIKFLENIKILFNELNLVPIIAHPERYKYIQQNVELVEKYVDNGFLIQCNYGSILGLYGRKAKKTVKQLLKKDLVSFLGSDCHKSNTIYKQMPKAIKKISKIIGKEKLDILTQKNPEKIINNEKISK